MGRKGWFRSMKKAMGSDSKDQNDQGPSRSKKKWFGKKKATDPIPRQEEVGAETAAATSTSSTTATATAQPIAAPPPPPQENPRSNEIEEMQKQHTCSIAIATAKAAEAAMAAAELTRLTNTPRFPGKLKEEGAAIRIQTAFRGYTARRALRVLRGLARLKTLMQGPSVKRQTTNALKCMQTLVRVQYEIQARRLSTSEENQARQRQLLEKHGKELDKLQVNNTNLQQTEDGWNASFKTKEQIQARVQSKHDAAVRRERALAYSFNHQRTWRNPATTKPAPTLFVDSINPHWGWSWLERWLAARPWENAAPANPDLAPLRSSLNAPPSGSQIAKALLYHVKEKQQTQSATSSPRSSVHSPRSTTAPKQRNSTGRLSTSSTPKARAKARAPATPNNEDAVSVRSEQSRRQSAPGDLDNDSLASSPAGGSAVVPSYMAPTESARARSRLGSPNSADRMPMCSGKRRVSYPSSPARSRRSTSSITDADSVGDGK